MVRTRHCISNSEQSRLFFTVKEFRIKGGAKTVISSQDVTSVLWRVLGRELSTEVAGQGGHL